MAEITDPALLAQLNGGPIEITDPKILAQLNGTAPVEEPGMIAAGARVAGLGARAAAQAPVSAVLGLPAAVGDSFMGVGRDILYGGKLALSKTGAVEAPDPKNYYSRDNWPLSGAASKVAAAIPDAVGLPEPKTTKEKMGTAAAEGVLSAMTGVGIGNSIARFGPAAWQAAGRFFADAPKLQATAGALGGAAGEYVTNELGANQEGAITASVAANALPFLARGAYRGVTHSNLGTLEGRERIAGQALREAASDPDRAIANLQGARSRVPGFMQFSTNAAQDYGLASNAQKFRDWGEGLPAQLEANNNRVVSGWFDRFSGADTGGAPTTRREANTVATNDLRAMDLRNRPRMDITELLDDLARESNARRNPNSPQTAVSAAGEIRSDLMSRAFPRINSRREVIGYTIPPEALYTQRRDITGASRPSADPNARLPNVRQAGAYTRTVVDRIDEALGDVTGGDFNRYITDQRARRNIADRQEFMADFADRKSLPSYAPDGSMQINKGGFLSAMKDVNADRPVGGSGRTTTLNKVRETDPMVGSFLDALQADLNAASFVDSPGLKSRGSSTSRNADIGANIDDITKSNRSIGDRVVGPVAGLASRFLGLPGELSGATNSGVAALANSRARDAGAGVRRIIGAAEVDPAAMARLMALPENARRSFLGSAGRGALEASRAYPGFMSGSRSNERRERRYR